MKFKRRNIFIKTILIVILSLLTCSCGSNQKENIKADWPEATNLSKPWTRWWWHGSAVTEKGITENLEDLKNAGFGGVEITPIYGVKGYENNDITFLSKEWMKIFEYTLKECKRLGLEVDLANASGWPFGGPWISSEEACKNVQYKIYELKAGQILPEKVEFIQEPLIRAVGHEVDIKKVKYPISSNNNLQELALDQVRFEKSIPLQTLMGYSDKGEIIDLTDFVDRTGKLNWTAKKGNWKIYAVFQGWHGKMVERAGKGGEGNVIDHFSETATKHFLDYFDKNADEIKVSGLRAFFNDSYEVDDARGESDWTPLLFAEFLKLRGYDLRNYLPALFGNDSEELNKRVLCDYRETISDLLLERFTNVWRDWAKKYGAIVRNQAHGSPANILDLYAASDIPETEGTTPLRIKMASSAGHVSGKPLIACEAATWLDEHFLSDLSEVKENVDRYFTNGVNHIVYHGTPYSPKNEKWPGWLFYASTHFAPTNTWWDELSTINSYISNVQSFLQDSKPANDILLYFPIYDKWSEPGNSRLHHFGHDNEDLTKELSEALLNKGFTFDYISDKQIRNLKVEGNKLVSNNISYKTIILTDCKFIPLETIEKIIELVKNGANLILENGFPESISGLQNYNDKSEAYKKLKDEINFVKKEYFEECKISEGRIIKTSEVLNALSKVDISPVSLAEEGIWFNKVQREEGVCYFITNWSDKELDKWVKFNVDDNDAVIFNPMNEKFGKAKIKLINNTESEVYLQLGIGETLLLQWYSAKQNVGDYPFFSKTSDTLYIGENWEVEFIKGGPALPAKLKLNDLISWPEISEELTAFSGTAKYSTSFSLQNLSDQNYMLDLGVVYESAVVILNGEKLTTLVGPEFKVIIEPGKLKESNTLEILVTNLMANRIIDMENRGEEYRKFYNINFSAKYRENYINGLFSAKHWQPLESGLLGPVEIIKLHRR